MGFITDLAKAAETGQGRELWNRVFGAVSKEDGHAKPVSRQDSHSRSFVDEPAVKRLLAALRSKAPGSWTDDRWEQSKHFRSIAYVAIHRKCEQLAQSEFQVFIEDDDEPDGKRPIHKDEPAQPGFDASPWELVELLKNPNHEDSFGDFLYCFPAGTMIRMADGSQKPIEAVQLLDEVLTAEGNCRKVRRCHVREYAGDLVNLRLWGHKHLKMTPNHRVLTRRGYVAAGKLVKGDWVCIPKYAAKDRVKVIQTAAYAVVGKQKHANVTGYLKDMAWGNYKRLPDLIELSPGFGRIIGLYLAEGYATEGKSTVTWSFGTHEAGTLVADLVRLLWDELGVEANTFTVNEKGTVTLVQICGALWVKLFRSLCGAGARAKRIHPDLMSGPDDFLEAVFDGWIDGDGHERRGGACGATVSHVLALNMFDVANYLGWVASVGWKEFANPTSFGGRGHWWVGIRKQPRQSLSPKARDNYRVLVEDNRVWRKVRGIESAAFRGNVFNFGVEGDNSYVAEGIGVHNCYGQQMDLTGTLLAWTVPNVFGVPFELYPIPTATAVPQAVMNPQYPDGFYRIQPLYPYGPFSSTPTPFSAVGAPIDAKWMLRIKFPHPLLRYEGWSPLTALSLENDELESISRSRFYKMKRSINPSAVLNMDGVDGMEPLPDPEIDRLLAMFEAMHQGPEQHGNLIVAPPGGKLEEFGSRAVDMDYPAGWDQLVAFLMAGLGITKPAAGMIEDANYASLFATLKQLHLLTLQPMCNRLAAKLTKHLAKFFGKGLIIEIRCPRIDDHEVKGMKIDRLIQAKAITKNELRKELDMPLTGEEWGDDIAGDPSEKEQEQQQSEQEGKVEIAKAKEDGAADRRGHPFEADGKMKEADEGMESAAGGKLDEQEAARTQPRPGPLGRGALGSRGSVKAIRTRRDLNGSLSYANNG